MMLEKGKCALGRIRTCDFTLRRGALYPAELPRHNNFIYKNHVLTYSKCLYKVNICVASLYFAFSGAPSVGLLVIRLS